jgi:poly-gamma-glutamate capsule biosynthesis protein CapA/YwtB (metallophosphatase superfamily)
VSTILIAADICPIEDNLTYFINGDATTLFNDLLPEIQGADLAIANLECPLIEQPSSIVKTGPVFGESSACINGIRQAGFDVLCLANNHIMDHGPAGLENTLRVCAKAGISTVGAGPNLSAASQILINKVGNLRIGVLALAEHEFSIATASSYGANPLDLIDFVRTVNQNRRLFDYLVVLLHGSHEFLVPTPRIKKTCRFMIEMGANAVIVQHPHCLGCYEDYRDGHIVYGQGALILDEPIYRNLKSFHEGFLVKLTIGDDLRSQINIVPFVQSDPAPGARRMPPDREQQFRQAVADKSAAIKDDAFVEAQWRRFCEERKHSYVSTLLGHNRVLRKLNSSGWVQKIIYADRQLLAVKNIVACETHREAVETIFARGITG